MLTSTHDTIVLKELRKIGADHVRAIPVSIPLDIPAV